MAGFEIWYDGQCLHRDEDYEVECLEDLYEDAFDSANVDDRIDNLSEVMIKVFNDEDSEELSIEEIARSIRESEMV